VIVFGRQGLPANRDAPCKSRVRDHAVRMLEAVWATVLQVWWTGTAVRTWRDDLTSAFNGLGNLYPLDPNVVQ
jgi:hypothetical protein